MNSWAYFKQKGSETTFYQLCSFAGIFELMESQPCTLYKEHNYEELCQSVKGHYLNTLSEPLGEFRRWSLLCIRACFIKSER